MNTTTAAGLSIGSTGTAAAEVRLPQVEEQIKTLTVNASDLENILSEIEHSLGTVTRPLPTLSDPKLSVPEPVLVPLATELRAISARVRESVNRLRELNGAIELSSVH